MRAIRKLDNLEAAWRVIQQNGRASKSPLVRLELERFAEDAQRNLRSLQGKLSRGSFRFEKAKGVPIPKLDGNGRPTGKIRPIVLAPVASRIVQRALLNVLIDIDALKPFVKTPYSFGGIRSLRKRGEQGRSEEISAVPAAIKAVLDQIGQGAKFIATADIRAFFTRISKDRVVQVIGEAVGDDPKFLAFVRAAIKVELENIATLKNAAGQFPTEEIGVAQGNSLSPLLGNIALASFDKAMNDGDCRCIRYIDDFIIMAPTQRAANARLRKSIGLLEELGMELSPEKSSKGGSPVELGFDFLGISICPGLIRPAEKARKRFIDSVGTVLHQTQKAMIGLKNGNPLPSEQSLVATLKRIDGMIEGWGKHYWFCNDKHVFAGIDKQIDQRLADFLGSYSSVRNAVPASHHRKLLGLAELTAIDRTPFAYPSS
ncbi:reverse transcriptase domain-containing protein [Novosphingobium sp. RL4]|uniref:reverse transcriptase domain-containing protein n=1 Tax=Novosphingobium sp. RL4 TaxID=3109595 RepID=UPI002D792F11|nr:reverse transcriptase domain-containing protein [Novosphingobium sp. RL4]WRT94045.1 reverse transcriptase domain-containing protein [Novosphingobium sp. RL4]